MLITTLTKRMSEDLKKFFDNSNIRSRYLHSEIDSLERVSILRINWDLENKNSRSKFIKRRTWFTRSFFSNYFRC